MAADPPPEAPGGRPAGQAATAGAASGAGPADRRVPGETGAGTAPSAAVGAGTAAQPRDSGGQAAARRPAEFAPPDPVLGTRGATPLFLGRETYRNRRVMDAARLLPVFGTALLLLPLLWSEDHATASGAVYLFLAWFGLILSAGLLARRLAAPLRARDRARRVAPDGSGDGAAASGRRAPRRAGPAAAPGPGPGAGP